MLKLGKGLFADNKEEAIWYNQAEETRLDIKRLHSTLKKSKEDIKISSRELHKKFVAGAKARIHEIKPLIRVKREFLKFCERKIKTTK